MRQVFVDYNLNHLIVAKAYQTLVEDGIVEKRRGLGMFVLRDKTMVNFFWHSRKLWALFLAAVCALVTAWLLRHCYRED